MQTDRLQVKGVNKVVYADQYSGATADVQIAAALAAVGSGGTVDARGFGATVQSIASTVTISAGQTLICDLATRFQPASNALTMFTILPNGHLSGVQADISATAGFTGKVFNFSGANYGDDTATFLSDFRISGFSVTGGTGIYMRGQDVNTIRVAFVSISRGRIAGLQNGIYLQADGTAGGWVNGNHFQDIEISNSQNGITFDNAATGAGTSVRSNLFTNISIQNGAATLYGVRMIGTQPILENKFVNLQIWDTTTPFSIPNAAAQNNLFMGSFNGTVTDNGFNDYIDCQNHKVTFNSLQAIFRNQAYASSLFLGSSNTPTDQFQFNNGAISKKGVTWGVGGNGDINFWLTSTETGAGFNFNDNVNGNLASIDATGNVITRRGFIVNNHAAPVVSANQVGLGSTHATTVGAAGGATALPATPLGYLIANVDGTQVKIPYYNN